MFSQLHRFLASAVGFLSGTPIRGVTCRNPRRPEFWRDQAPSWPGIFRRIAALTIFLVAIRPFSVTAASLVADYRFEDTLKSSVSGAPELTLEGSISASFVIATNLLGTNHPVLNLPTGGGFRLNTTGLVASNQYTVVLLVAQASTGSYLRILDTQEPTRGEGWFTLGGALIFHPTTNSGPGVIQAEQFIQLTLVKSGDQVRAYANGAKQFELSDLENRAQIGGNGVVHFFRQADGSYASGGRVARIRLYNGALTDTEVAALTPVAPISVIPASGAKVVADYRFESSLKSSVNGAPDLTVEGANNIAFVSDLVFGTNRTVLDFVAGGGVHLDTTGLLSRDRYTMVALFESASVGTARILDARDTADAQGLFFNNGHLWINPYPPAVAGGVVAGQYTQIALVDDGQYVHVYQDGIKILDLVDTLDLAALGANQVLHFLLHDG